LEVDLKSEIGEGPAAPGIRLQDGTADAIRRHAARSYPDECCGAMLGRKGDAGGSREADGKRDETRTVIRTLPIDNARTDSARNRFLVTDRDYLRAEAEAAAHGLDLIGFYHSHPDHVARPSKYDLDHALPVFSYVIVSVVAGRSDLMTSWILEEDRSRFRPEPLREIRSDSVVPSASQPGPESSPRSPQSPLPPRPRPRPIPARQPRSPGARK